MDWIPNPSLCGIFELYVNQNTTPKLLQKHHAVLTQIINATAQNYNRHWKVEKQGSTQRRTGVLDADLDLNINNCTAAPASRADRKNFADRVQTAIDNTGLYHVTDSIISRKAIQLAAQVVDDPSVVVEVDLVILNTTFVQGVAQARTDVFRNPKAQQAVKGLKLLVAKGGRFRALPSLNGFRYEALVLAEVERLDRPATGLELFLSVLHSFKTDYTDARALTEYMAQLLAQTHGIEELPCFLQPGVLQAWRNHSISILKAFKRQGNVTAPHHIEEIFMGSRK